MGLWNTFRVTLLIIFGLLFLVTIGVFGLTYFFANNLFTNNTADLITNNAIQLMPNLLGGELPPELANSISSEESRKIFDPIVKRNVYSVMGYVRGELDTIKIEVTPEDTKQIINVIGFSEYEKEQITEEMYSEMANSLNQNLSSDLMTAFSPLKSAYEYAKSLYYLSFGILLVLMLLVFLINFNLIKSFFWLALYFIINSLIWLFAVIIGYYSMIPGLSALANSSSEGISEGILAGIKEIISGLLFKLGTIYFVLFVFGLIFLGLFYFLKIRNNKKQE